MIGRDYAWHPYNRASILANAPSASGVYALFRDEAWIYVGESGDIQARLPQHLGDDHLCITRNQPIGFQFEFWVAKQRIARQNQLIAALNPICNQRMG